MNGLLAGVRDEIAAGTSTIRELARRLGTSEDLARAAVWHLARLGQIPAPLAMSGCPAPSCGSCALNRTCAR